MRLYISADIEGICGVVTSEHTRPGGCEYEWARDRMTDSVVAVCETAHDCGVEELIVSDSHGNGLNIRLERMPDFVRLVRSWPRPLGMMQGIEQGRFAGALLLGYHAAGHNSGGVLSHSMSSSLFHELRINGSPASEALISAALAGEYDVPVLMMAGDDVAVAETSATLGGIATATLMQSYGTHSAICPAPSVALDRLRDATRLAVERVGTVRPMRLSGPVELDIVLRTRTVAEWLAYLPETERMDAYTIRYRGADMIALSRFLMFVTFGPSTLAT